MESPVSQPRQSWLFTEVSPVTPPPLPWRVLVRLMLCWLVRISWRKSCVLVNGCTVHCQWLNACDPTSESLKFLSIKLIAYALCTCKYRKELRLSAHRGKKQIMHGEVLHGRVKIGPEKRETNLFDSSFKCIQPIYAVCHIGLVTLLTWNTHLSKQ